MQSIAWYIRRLSTMSPGEIAWRFKLNANDILDRYRFQFGWYPSLDSIQHTDDRGFLFGFENEEGDAEHWATRPGFNEFQDRLIPRAEKIVEHRLSFFNLKDHFLGNPIDWNRDHGHGQEAPLSYSQSIDYRDFRVTGDCKLVWEPNRHHHLVVLGRAYRVSGDIRYAAEVVAQLQSWMDQCPFAKGMNWRSPLELGIRLINWVWATELIRESRLVDGEFQKRLLHNVYLHLWEVSRKFSKGSSANNHLVGEAAGVYIGSSYFRNFQNGAKWQNESRRILIHEIMEQTYPDGCTREQAMGYHLFVLQFFIIAGLVGRWTGQDFPVAYWQRIEKMLEFAGAMSEGGENLPMFGDGDDGYVLDLGSGPGGAKDLLCIGAILFKRPDFKALSGGFREAAVWMLGRGSWNAFEALPKQDASRALISKSFSDSGCYLLQCGEAESQDRISMFMDCGELGFKSIAAHGHADGLSFVLRAFGRDVFVDPGTYDYFTYPEWRNYFRSTRAHNTVCIDGLDQSVMLGSFMWGKRAQTRCVLWEPSSTGGGKLVAEHDGYRRLADPTTHRRTVELRPESREVAILDELTSADQHTVSIFFHLAEDCAVTKIPSNRLEIALPSGDIMLQLDPSLEVSLLKGSESPKGGWVSRGYHCKAPSTTVVASGLYKGKKSFKSVVKIGNAGL